MPTRGLVIGFNIDCKARHFGDLARGGIDPESVSQAQHDQALGEAALSKLSAVSSTWWKLNSSRELLSTFKFIGEGKEGEVLVHSRRESDMRDNFSNPNSYSAS